MVHVVERLAEFAQAHRARPIAPQVLHHAKRAVIDWHAALFPGARVAPATALERALAEELDHGEARLARGRRASVRAAALINGAAAHTVEVDDIFREGIYHPGAPTIAAALAVAQSRRASGEQFLRAVIVGYEISTRIAAAMGRAHYKYWHNTGTIGCFGAASAAAELLGLDRKRFAHALATVATFSAGLSRRFAWIRCPSPCTRGARRKPASPRHSRQPKASRDRSTSWRAKRASAARWVMELRAMARTGSARLQPLAMISISHK